MTAQPSLFAARVMGRDGGEDTPGTVYYAVSLTALALFSFGIGAALRTFCGLPVTFG